MATNKTLVPIAASNRKAGVKKPTFKKGVSGVKNLSDEVDSKIKEKSRRKLNLF